MIFIVKNTDNKIIDGKEREAIINALKEDKISFIYDDKLVKIEKVVSKFNSEYLEYVSTVIISFKDISDIEDIEELILEAENEKKD